MIQLFLSAEDLNCVLNALSSWSADSHLASQPHQDQVVLSSSQMSRVHSLGQLNPSLGISNRSLERVILTKLLGIYFSEHVSWEEHVRKLSKTCYIVFGVLRKIKKITRNTYLAITFAKLKLSPVQLETGWVTRSEYRHEGPFFGGT